MHGGRDVSGLLLAFLPLLPLGALVCVWGALRPLYHTAIHQAIDDADRTTLVSAENLLANLLEAVVILPIAAVQDRLGLLAAFATAVRPPCPLRSAAVLCALMTSFGSSLQLHMLVVLRIVCLHRRR